MTGRIFWSEANGFWAVEDQHGDKWNVVCCDNGSAGRTLAAIQRETHEGWEAAYFNGEPHKDVGDIVPQDELSPTAEFRSPDGELYRVKNGQWVEVVAKKFEVGSIVRMNQKYLNSLTKEEAEEESKKTYRITSMGEFHGSIGRSIKMVDLSNGTETRTTSGWLEVVSE